MPELDDDVIYDHLPDGTILEPMPFGDAQKMLKLVRERMTPEALADMTTELAAHADRHA